MGLRINTNTQSLASLRAMKTNKENLDRTVEKLSSGFRINHAGDDAAGLAISENLRAQIRSLRQASRNANDGIGLVQVAEGAIMDVTNILIRMRELSIQGASDTVGDPERQYIDKEIQGIKEEINRIALGTQFNGQKLLTGDGPALEIQVGAHNDPLEDRLLFDSSRYHVSQSALGITDVSTQTQEQAQNNLDLLDNAIRLASEKRAELGALQNRLSSTIDNLGVYTENLSAAQSRVRDTDIAEEASELTKGNILFSSNVAMQAQTNVTPQAALRLITNA